MYRSLFEQLFPFGSLLSSCCNKNSIQTLLMSMSSNFTPTEHSASQFSWHKARGKNSKVLFWHKERCDSPRGYIEFSICIQVRKRRDLHGDMGIDDEADTVWWCTYKNSSQRWGTLYWLYFLDKNSKNFCCVCRFWLRRKDRIFQFYLKMHVNFGKLHEVCEMSWYSRESLRVFLGIRDRPFLTFSDS